MSWQAFSWHEMIEQARVAHMAERLQPAIGWTGAVSREALELTAAFLAPAALSAVSLAVWRIGADLGMTGEFCIEDGVFSHWQVWLALGLGLQSAAVALKKHLKNAPSTAEKRIE